MRTTTAFARSAPAASSPRFAGTGQFTWAGDGGPAAAGGSFAQPTALAFDAGGNLFISDASNRRVRKIDTSGNLSTVAGNGLFKYSGDNAPAILANLWAPYIGVPDGSGNLYIVDSNAALIRKVTAGGIISTIAGNHNYGLTGNGGPASGAMLSNFSTYAIVDGAGNASTSPTPATT